MITEITSSAYIRATMGMNNGIWSIYAVAATNPPRASDPVSPINTLAGYTLKSRNPKSAPTTAHVIGSIPLAVPMATAVKKVAIITVTLLASPSSPSVIMSVAIAFSISVVLGPVIIPFLKRLKVGQTERDDGPESHLKKSGTPTMGGILILIGVAATSVVYMKDYPKIMPILFVTLGFGLIGFLDDYIKVVLHRSMGLRAWQKMLGQIVVTGVFAYYMVNYAGVSLAMKIPFWPGKYVDWGILNIPVLFFVVIATVNGANFTDGLDGLASSVTVMIATFFTAVANTATTLVSDHPHSSK